MLQIYNSVGVLYIVALLTASITSMIYMKNRSLDPIRFYFLENIVAMIFHMFIPDTDFGKRVNHVQFNLFFFLDLAVLYYYFWTLIVTRLFSRIVLGSFMVIAGICIYFWVNPRYGLSTFMPMLFGIQNLFIIIPCLLYIYELFKSDEEKDLKFIPHFYIACAVLFYYGATFPFFMTYEGFYNVTTEIAIGLSSVQVFLASLMNFTFIKAFLCPFPEPK